MNKKIISIVITILIIIIFNVTNIMAINSKIPSFDSLGNKISNFYSQNNVISYKDGCLDGYTICSVIPFMLLGEGHYASLIDMEGNVINTWSTGTRSRFLDNGNLVDTAADAPGQPSRFHELDWDGNVVWEYSEKRKNYNFHHDYLE